MNRHRDTRGRRFQTLGERLGVYNENNEGSNPDLVGFKMQYGNRSIDDLLKIKSIEERFSHGAEFFKSLSGTCYCFSQIDLSEIWDLLKKFNFQQHKKVFLRNIDVFPVSFDFDTMENETCPLLFRFKITINKSKINWTVGFNNWSNVIIFETSVEQIGSSFKVEIPPFKNFYDFYSKLKSLGVEVSDTPFSDTTEISLSTSNIPDPIKNIIGTKIDKVIKLCNSKIQTLVEEAKVIQKDLLIKEHNKKELRDKALHKKKVRRDKELHEKQMEQLDNAPDDMLCGICLSASRNVIFDECKHLYCCYDCALKCEGKCPCCRVESDFTKIYVQ